MGGSKIGRIKQRVATIHQRSYRRAALYPVHVTNYLPPQLRAVQNVRIEHAKKRGTKESPMEIQRIGTKPSGKGPAEFFTGSVRVDPLILTTPPARLGGAVVTFEPGARSAWHTHPLGQM